MPTYKTPLDAPSTIPDALTETARRVELDFAARTLQSASIGAGGLSVRDGSRIDVFDGGGLDLRAGNIVLGRGQIDGPALRNQALATSEQAAESGFATSTAWATKVQRAITSKPGWAKSATIMVSGTVMAYLAYSNDSGWGYRVRLWVQDGSGTTYGLTHNAVLTHAGAGNNDWFFSGSPSLAHTTTDLSGLRMGLQAYGTDSKLYPANSRTWARLSAAILWTR